MGSQQRPNQRSIGSATRSGERTTHALTPSGRARNLPAYVGGTTRPNTPYPGYHSPYRRAARRAAGYPLWPGLYLIHGVAGWEYYYDDSAPLSGGGYYDDTYYDNSAYSNETAEVPQSSSDRVSSWQQTADGPILEVESGMQFYVYQPEPFWSRGSAVEIYFQLADTDNSSADNLPEIQYDIVYNGKTYYAWRVDESGDE